MMFVGNLEMLVSSVESVINLVFPKFFQYNNSEGGEMIRNLCVETNFNDLLHRGTSNRKCFSKIHSMKESRQKFAFSVKIL